jgi:TonB family protein
MAKGKKTCKILKEIRRQIAEANDIEYVVEECQYKGDCLGTCPKCEAEVRYLEQQLHQRQLLGKAVMVAGISAGLLSLSSCGNEMYDQISNQDDGEVMRGKEPIPEDWVMGEIVELMPSFPGGTSALMKFLTENIEYPEQMIKDSIQGRVICSFIVGRDGAISDIKVVRSLHPLLDKEAVRVLSLMPKWIPGKQNGQPSKVKYNLPITFRLQNASDSITVKKE